MRRKSEFALHSIMIDIIGDPARFILEYLDFNSLLHASNVSQSWHDVVLQHKSLILRHYIQAQERIKLEKDEATVSLWSSWLNEALAETCSTKELMALTKTMTTFVDSNYYKHYEERRTPLDVASKSGFLQAVTFLIDHRAPQGENSQYDDKNFGVALHLACLEGHFDIVKLLLDKGAQY